MRWESVPFPSMEMQACGGLAIKKQRAFGPQISYLLLHHFNVLHNLDHTHSLFSTLCWERENEEEADVRELIEEEGEESKRM